MTKSELHQKTEDLLIEAVVLMRNNYGCECSDIVDEYCGDLDDLECDGCVVASEFYKVITGRK